MKYAIFILIQLVTIQLAFAGEQEIFALANQAYIEEDYQKARDLYDSLVNMDVVSPELYYNLANCYYKLNETAESILYYEKGLKLEPRDEDILFNLKLARLNVISKIEEKEQVYFSRLFENFLDSFSLKLASWLTVLLIWLSFLSGLVYLMSRSVSVKKISLFFVIVFLFTFLLGFFTTFAKERHMRNQHEAILMATNTYIKSSPDKNSTDLFILHEGVKLKLLDQVNDWYKIRIADGKVGWVESSKIEKI